MQLFILTLVLFFACGCGSTTLQAPSQPVVDIPGDTEAPVVEDEPEAPEEPSCDPQKLAVGDYKPVAIGDINGDGRDDYSVNMRTTPRDEGMALYASHPTECFVKVYEGPVTHVSVKGIVKNGWNVLEMTVPAVSSSGTSAAITFAHFDGTTYTPGEVTSCFPLGPGPGPDNLDPSDCEIW